METVPLKATIRSESGKGHSRRLRDKGQIPSVAYGRGTSTLSLAISRSGLRDILVSNKGRNTLIELDVEGDKHSVMVKDFAIHPVSRLLLHADFIEVDLTQPVTVEVPFTTYGKSAGETQGGTLLQLTRVLDVECLPTQIPDSIDYEVSKLEIDNVVRVSDLSLPEAIKVLNKTDQKLVVVKPPRVETTGAGEGAEGEGEAAGEAGEAAPAAEEKS